jgi:hypothetical protein
VTDEVVQFPRHRGDANAGTFHGPVDREVTNGPDHSQTIVFTGTEETDVLHAAAGYMADHRYATITSLNWKGDVAPDVDYNPLRYALEMVVDLSYYLAPDPE